MKLYQTHKVNPVGGCLPLLLQLPVFIALYRALFVSIELRQSPFIFWIKDLSEMDPYYITPIVMGASYFLQQKLTPSSADPTQQKMMMMMPIMFTIIFLNLPSGLVLYFFVSNLLSIGQQLYMNKIKKD
jgi:YidC/Oxa1 family membrane protein insertase